MNNMQSHFYIKKELGSYIASLRFQHALRMRDLASSLGISTPYLSQIEHGTRLNPSPLLIRYIAEKLSLSKDETLTLYDLYAEATGQLPPDITEYLTGNQVALQALRQARDANVTAEDWERFIGQLKK